ncbi:hypothetical protein GCM10020221_20160 [Streptomyces thioluteus]|uniref:Metallo-beta-lactamase domain-containing protein n=1 Tax=Streptomyces thioluteus TaxID=66431 RepID=A0ABP6J8E0_STRTU
MPVEAVFFNVGQGDCTLLWFYDLVRGKKTGTNAVLIDCGTTGAVLHHNASPSRETPKQQLVQRLRDKIGKYLDNLPTPGFLDYLIITHPDEDHFNLLRAVLEPVQDSNVLVFSIGKILYGLGLLDYRDRTKFVSRLVFDWQDFKDHADRQGIAQKPELINKPAAPVPLLTGRQATQANLYLVGAACGYEDKGALESGDKSKVANKSSLVTVLVGDGPVGTRQKVLLMADAVATNEEYLVLWDGDLCKREANLWLKLGHHASETSTTNEWLDWTTPDGLFISTGLKKFSGSATCRVKNMNRVVPYWNSKRKGPLPQATVPNSCGYVAQDDLNGPNGSFVHTPASGVFSSMALPNQRGVDWHLRLDSQEPNGYAIEYA